MSAATADAAMAHHAAPAPAISSPPHLGLAARAALEGDNVVPSEPEAAMPEPMGAVAAAAAASAGSPAATRGRGRAAAREGAATERLYGDASRAREKMQKRMSDAAEAAALESSFTPRITDRARRRSSSSSRLYVDKAEQQRRQAELSAKRAQQETSGCTFRPELRRSSSQTRKPRLSHDPAAAGAPPSPAGAAAAGAAMNGSVNGAHAPDSPAPATPNGNSNGNGAGQQQHVSASSPYERLYENKTERDARLARLAAEQRRLDAAKCTFRPDTSISRSGSALRLRQHHDTPTVDSSAAAAGGGAAEPNSPMPVEDRLTGYLAKRDANLERLAQELRSEEKKDLTFKPRLGRKSAAAAAAARYREQHAAAAAAAGDPEAAAAPEAVPPPAAAAPADPFSRLMATPVGGGTRSVARRREIEEEQRREITFQPRLIARSHSASAGSRRAGLGPGDAPVHERLARYQQEQAARRQRLEAELNSERLKECTFQPQVPHRRASTAPSPSAGAATTAGDSAFPAGATATATSGEAAAAGSGGQAAAADAENDAHRPAVWERLNENRATQLRLLEMRRASQELEQCTFAPVLVARGGAAGGAAAGSSGSRRNSLASMVSTRERDAAAAAAAAALLASRGPGREAEEMPPPPPPAVVPAEESAAAALSGNAENEHDGRASPPPPPPPVPMDA